MKTLRLVAKLFGISLLILGFNASCKKDKDGSVPDCVNCSYSYAGQSINFSVCKDDVDWESEFDSWEDAYNYLRDEFDDEGFDCD